MASVIANSLGVLIPPVILWLFGAFVSEETINELIQDEIRTGLEDGSIEIDKQKY
jgi:hypothetical protein